MRLCPFCHQQLSDQSWSTGNCPKCEAELPAESSSVDASLQTLVDESVDVEQTVEDIPESTTDDANYKTLIEDELNAEMRQAEDVASTLEMDRTFGNPCGGKETLVDTNELASDKSAKTVHLGSDHALGDEEPSETIFDDVPSRPTSTSSASDSGSKNGEESGMQTVVTDSGAVPFDENKTVVLDDAPDSAKTVVEEGVSRDESGVIEKTWGMGLADATDPGMTIKGFDTSSQSSGSQQSIPVRHLEPQNAPNFSEAEYQLVKVLGEGGMGIVWNALQSSVERNVAIKMIKTAIASKPGQTEKFIAEAIVTGDLEHPNIVPIHEMGQDREGNFFYAMKHVQGTPWNKAIDKKSLHENLEILLSVCDAIAFSHARGIIHRDLKPENIMLGGYGEVLVMDWGLALPTAEFRKRDLISSSHGMGGTPAYMAPEMATGPLEKISYTSDVYLLGAILYEIVTERPPHRGKTVQGCLANAMRNIITPTEHDSELVKIATKAMQFDQEKRFASVKEFQDALRGYLAHEKSLKLSQRATVELNEAIKSSDYEKFSRSLFGFEEAIALWANNKKAKQLLLDAHYQYANCAFVKGDFDLAESLVDAEESDHKLLYEKIHEAKRERDRKQRMFRLAKFVVAGLAAAIFLIIGVSYYLINQEMIRATKAEEIANDQKTLAEKRTLEVIEEKEKVEEQKTIAQQERDNAETERKKAEEQKKIAVVEKNNAIQSREAEQYKSYIANIGLAAAKVEENAFTDAKNLLLKCPASLRNWEWGRLMYLCSQSSREYLAKAPVDSLDFSPDGLQFATASWDGKVRIWERDSGKLLRELDHEKIYVHSVDWSPRGNLIASGGNDKKGNLKIWEANTGKLLANVVAHTDAVLNVKFSDDQRWLVTCSYDNTARLWDLENPSEPKPGAVLVGHTWWVWDADFAPGFSPTASVEEDMEEQKEEKNRLVTVGQDGKAIVWEVTAQGMQAKPVVEFLEHQGPVYSVAYHPTRTGIATGGYDRKILYWDANEIVPFDFKAAVNGEKKEPQQFSLFAGHTGPVRAVSFSHQGKLLLSGAQDNTVKVWDIESKKSIKTFRGHASTVRACEMTNDGKYLLSGAEDHQALLWSVSDYAEIQTLNGQELIGHREAILSAYFSPSGKDILTASRDRTARLWETETGTQRLTLKEGHQFLSSSAVFFQDEKLLATAAADSSVRIWNVTSGAEMSHLLGTGRNALVAISSDDSLIVTGSNTNDLMVWNTESLLSQQKAEPVAQLSGHHHPVTSIVFVPKTKQLISADTHGRCSLWNAKTGKQIWTSRHHTLKITDLRIIDQGKKLLTASIDRTIGVTNIQDGKEILTEVMSHEEPVIAVDTSMKQTVLLSVVNRDDEKQNDHHLETIIYRWDLSRRMKGKPQPAQKIILKGFRTNDISISYDEKMAILTCSDNTIKTVDLETEQVHVLFDGNQHGGLLWSSHLSEDGQRLLTVGGIDARLWDLKTGKERMSFGPHGAVAATAMHPLENIVVTGSWDHSLKFWEARTGKSTGKISNAHDAYINSVAYSYDGKLLVSAGDGGIAKIWDVKTRKELMQLKGHTAGIHLAIFSPDDQLILTASRDRTLRLWNRQTGEQIGKPFKGHHWAVLTAKFSPDGKFIVSGSEDNNAILWDRKTRKKLGKMSGHTAAVTSVAYSEDGMRILTASRDNTAKLWDATPGHRGIEILTLKRHQQEVTSVDFSVDRLKAVTGSRDGTAIIWSAIDWKKP